MNKNIIPILLIIIAIGIYFSFTTAKMQELNEIQAVNAQYQKAIDDFSKLVSKRDEVVKQYNDLNTEDRDRLERLLPNNVDNVRLIIDINGIAAKHGITMSEVKSDADKDPTRPSQQDLGGIEVEDSEPGFNTMALSFKVKSNYQNFVAFLEDLERSLRILDVSKITLETLDSASTYDYEVEVRTYWLKEIK